MISRSHDSLPDSPALPSTPGTRQSLKYTRQRAHSKKINGKGLFAECYLSGTPQSICRVPKNTRQRKALDKIKTEKNPEKNSKKNLLNQVRHPPANARPCGIFRVKFTRFAAGGIRIKFTRFAAGGIQTRDLSLAHNLLYHSTTLSLVSILCFPSPHIITN